MRKCFNLFVLLVGAFCFANFDVFAASHKYNINDFDTCVSSSCVALCAYSNDITLYEGKAGETEETYSTYIYYDLKKNQFIVNWYTQETEKNDALKKSEINSSAIHFKGSEKSSLTEKGTCPKYAFVDTSALTEVCFSDNQTSCINYSNIGTHFNGTSKKEYDYMEQIENFYNDNFMKTANYKDFNEDEISKNISESVSTNFLHGYSLPSFIENNETYKGFKTQELNKVKEYIESSKEKIRADSSMTEEEKTEAISKLDSITDEQIQEQLEKTDKVIKSGDTKILNEDSNKYDDDFTHNCADFAKGIRIGGYLLVLIKVLVPLILIVKCILDIFKIVISSKPEDVMAYKTKAIASILSAIIIFLLPSMIEFIINMLPNGVKDSTASSDIEVCKACIFHPSSDECSQHIDIE